MGRIVRPGGGLAFFWNVLDGDAPAVLLADDAAPGPARRCRPRLDDLQAGRRPGCSARAGAFGEPWAAALPAVPQVRMTGEEFVADGLHDVVRPRQAPELQERLPRRDRQCLVAGTVRATTLDIPYRIDCWIARRSAP